MCRIIGKISFNKEAVKYELMGAPHSLLNMSKNGKHLKGSRGPHNDGWGMGYKEDGKIKIRKDVGAAYEDNRFNKLASKVKTDLLLGSAREASPGIPTSRENAHPFRKDNLVFVHNGCINDGLERKTESDTQDYLRWLSENWNGNEDKLVELLRKASESWNYTSITFLMTDGEKLYIFRRTVEEEKNLDYYTLYTHNTEEKITVASEPLDNKDWEILENGKLMIVESPREWEKYSIV